MGDVILTHVHGDHGMATKLMTAEPTWVSRLQPSSPKEDTNNRTQYGTTSEIKTDEPMRILHFGICLAMQRHQ